MSRKERSQKDISEEWGGAYTKTPSAPKLYDCLISDRIFC